jgi:hypothetical protein
MDRSNYVFPSDEDLSAMAFPANASLDLLEREGCVRKGMSKALFDARLKRAKQDTHARMVRTYEAEAQGWFQGQGDGLRIPDLFGPPAPAGSSNLPTSRYGRTVSVTIDP